MTTNQRPKPRLPRPVHLPIRKTFRVFRKSNARTGTMQATCYISSVPPDAPVTNAVLPLRSNISVSLGFFQIGPRYHLVSTGRSLSGAGRCAAPWLPALCRYLARRVCQHHYQQARSLIRASTRAPLFVRQQLANFFRITDRCRAHWR